MKFNQIVCLSIGALLLLPVQDVNGQDQTSSWKANPEQVAKRTKQRPEFNYHEEKVPAYELPNPLISADGNPVRSPAEWESNRRAELLELFRNHVYGRRPETAFTVDFVKVAEDDNALDGLAVSQSMKAVIRIEDRKFEFPFVVFLPKQSDGPVPAAIHINNRYFLSADQVAEKHDPFWPVRSILKRGYATASFHTSDVDPDKKDGYSDGIRSFFADGKPADSRDWRSLSAWGFGASRVLDYLQSIDAIDGKRVTISGHSRGGKASLWAAAEDPRFAIAYSNNSGCGGAALSRRAFGETVGRITSSFPHWFCKPFADYADRESELPVDQHQLMALIAPRGVYVASADEDLWADPKGEYLALVGAAPVFNLLGKDAIETAEMPALESQRIVGQTGYHIRSGGHGLGDQDWNWFLDFADQLLK